MAFYLAIKEIWRTKGRFLLFSGVIALITMLVLFVAALAEGLGSGNRQYIEKLNADLIVYQSNVDLSAGASRIGVSGLNKIRRVDGVKAVGPVGAASVTLVSPVKEGADPLNVALIGVILAAVWQMSGYTMAMYLAGIRGISEDLREAARVDGCSEIQVYTKIILPLLQPITLSAAIVLGHISLKVFDLIFAMAGTDYLPVSVPGVQVYTTMFRSNKFAIGSSIAIVLLVMVAVVIIPYLATALRGEHEV